MKRRTWVLVATVVPVIALLSVPSGAARNSLDAPKPPRAGPLTSAEVKELVIEYYVAVRSGDPEVWASKLADGVVLEDPVGSPPAVGRDAAKERYAAGAAEFQIDMFPADVFAPNATNEAAISWSVVLTDRVSGEHVGPFSGITHLRFDDAGLITSLRAFWDPTDTALSTKVR